MKSAILASGQGDSTHLINRKATKVDKIITPHNTSEGIYSCIQCKL